MNAKIPDENRQGVTNIDNPWELGSGHSQALPDRVSPSHKGGYPIWAAGAEMPPWKNFLRPPGNSPSRWHLTRHLLLCSGVTIHDFAENVNTFFSKLLRNGCKLYCCLRYWRGSALGSPYGRAGMPSGMTEREITLSAPVCELGHLSQRERQGVRQYPLNYNLSLYSTSKKLFMVDITPSSTFASIRNAPS